MHSLFINLFTWEYLIKNEYFGKDVENTWRDGYNRSLLYYAVATDDVPALTKMKENQWNLHEKDQVTGSSMLVVAAHYEQKKSINFLLDSDVLIDALEAYEKLEGNKEMQTLVREKCNLEDTIEGDDDCKWIDEISKERYQAQEIYLLKKAQDQLIKEKSFNEEEAKKIKQKIRSFLNENEMSDISKERYAAIKLYTEEKPAVYRVLNSNLRSRKDGSHISYARFLYYSVLTLPESGERELYRGVSLDLSDRYAVGKSYTFLTFVSASTNMKVADSFMSDKETGKKKKSPFKTIFIYKTVSSRRISYYSAFNTEDELLILPGTKFKVEKIEKLENLNVKQIVMVEERNK